ncbi:hypothetical protein ACIGO9_31505 [Nocardia asteroides]|uniref:hypothetical protein n=1 Tax=Nocardia asteroides TaxID=1824 RepID=UPI0037C76A8F
MSKARRIESLRRLAEHPATPPHERDAAHAMLKKLGVAVDPISPREPRLTFAATGGGATRRGDNARSWDDAGDDAEEWEHFGTRYDPRRSIHEVAILVRKELDARRAKGKRAEEDDLIAALPPSSEIAILVDGDTITVYVFGCPVEWRRCPRREEGLGPPFTDRVWALRCELEAYLSSFAAYGLDGDDNYVSIDGVASVVIRPRDAFDLEFDAEY